LIDEDQEKLEAFIKKYVEGYSKFSPSTSLEEN